MSDVANEACQLALRYRNRSHRAVFWNGHAAALNDRPVTDNPYADVRGNAGHVTFSRAYMRAWREGWECGRRERE